MKLALVFLIATGCTTSSEPVVCSQTTVVCHTSCYTWCDDWGCYDGCDPVCDPVCIDAHGAYTKGVCEPCAIEVECASSACIDGHCTRSCDHGACPFGYECRNVGLEAMQCVSVTHCTDPCPDGRCTAKPRVD